MSQATTTAGSIPAESVASTEQYNYAIVKRFAIAAVLWGVFGMAAGVWIASQLAWPFLNFDIAQITFGRFRPVHTTAVIFGFGGNALFATSYYIVQRTCQARLFGENSLPELHLLGLAPGADPRRDHLYDGDYPESRIRRV